MQVKKQELELDMEQQTGSKSGKEYVKAVYCHPAYLTSMQSTSWEMLEIGRASCRERVEAVKNFIFLDYKIMVTASMKLKDTFSLEGKQWQT